jgi:glycine/D-amino acid oxidase-like deaminating enzyme
MSRALVIGNGAAGTFSSWLLARRGWEVILVGRGTPCTAMSTGCMRQEPRTCHSDIWEFLKNDRMSWVTGNLEGISRIGTNFRCWQAPSHSTWREGDAPNNMAVVGLEGHPSLPVRVASAMLNGRGMKAEPFIMPGSIPPDMPLGSWFRSDGAWEALAKELGNLSAETILLPAFVPLHDYGRLDQLERRCGRRVLEAISPLGAPGQRLADLMLERAREVGATVWDGRKVVSLDVQKDVVRGATVLGGSEARDITADALVVATGGPLVDGLLLDGRRIMDPSDRFRVVRDVDALKGGYDSRNGRLLSLNGHVMNNAVAAGDCLCSKGREFGFGLTEALESAYLAVMALEGA